MPPKRRRSILKPANRPIAEEQENTAFSNYNLDETNMSVLSQNTTKKSVQFNPKSKMRHIYKQSDIKKYRVSTSAEDKSKNYEAEDGDSDDSLNFLNPSSKSTSKKSSNFSVKSTSYGNKENIRPSKLSPITNDAAAPTEKSFDVSSFIKNKSEPPMKANQYQNKSSKKNNRRSIFHKNLDESVEDTTKLNLDDSEVQVKLSNLTRIKTPFNYTNANPPHQYINSDAELSLLEKEKSEKSNTKIQIEKVSDERDLMDERSSDEQMQNSLIAASQETKIGYQILEKRLNFEMEDDDNDETKKQPILDSVQPEAIPDKRRSINSETARIDKDETMNFLHEGDDEIRLKNIKTPRNRQEMRVLENSMNQSNNHYQEGRSSKTPGSKFNQTRNLLNSNNKSNLAGLGISRLSSRVENQSNDLLEDTMALMEQDQKTALIEKTESTVEVNALQENQEIEEDTPPFSSQQSQLDKGKDPMNQSKTKGFLNFTAITEKPETTQFPEKTEVNDDEMEMEEDNFEMASTELQNQEDTFNNAEHEATAMELSICDATRMEKSSKKDEISRNFMDFTKQAPETQSENTGNNSKFLEDPSTQIKRIDTTPRRVIRREILVTSGSATRKSEQHDDEENQLMLEKILNEADSTKSQEGNNQNNRPESDDLSQEEFRKCPTLAKEPSFPRTIAFEEPIQKMKEINVHQEIDHVDSPIEKLCSSFLEDPNVSKPKRLSFSETPQNRPQIVRRRNLWRDSILANSLQQSKQLSDYSIRTTTKADNNVESFTISKFVNDNNDKNSNNNYNNNVENQSKTTAALEITKFQTCEIAEMDPETTMEDTYQLEKESTTIPENLRTKNSNNDGETAKSSDQNETEINSKELLKNIPANLQFQSTPLVRNTVDPKTATATVSNILQPICENVPDIGATITCKDQELPATARNIDNSNARDDENTGSGRTKTGTYKITESMEAELDTKDEEKEDRMDDETTIAQIKDTPEKESKANDKNRRLSSLNYSYMPSFMNLSNIDDNHELNKFRNEHFVQEEMFNRTKNDLKERYVPKYSKQLFLHRFVDNKNAKFQAEIKALSSFENILESFRDIPESQNQNQDDDDDHLKIFYYLSKKYENWFYEIQEYYKNEIETPSEDWIIRNCFPSKNRETLLVAERNHGMEELKHNVKWSSDYKKFLEINANFIEILAQLNNQIAVEVSSIKEAFYEKQREQQRLEREKIQQREMQELEQEKQRKLEQEKRLKFIKNQKWEPSQELLAQFEQIKMLSAKMEATKQRIVQKQKEVAEKDERIREINKQKLHDFEQAKSEKKRKIYVNGRLQAYCYKYGIIRMEKTKIVFKNGLEISFFPGLWSGDKNLDVASHLKVLDYLKSHEIDASRSSIVNYPFDEENGTWKISEESADFFKLKEVWNMIGSQTEGLGLYDEMVLNAKNFCNQEFGKTKSLHSFVVGHREFMFKNLFGPLGFKCVPEEQESGDQENVMVWKDPYLPPTVENEIN